MRDERALQLADELDALRVGASLVVSDDLTIVRESEYTYRINDEREVLTFIEVFDALVDQV